MKQCFYAGGIFARHGLELVLVLALLLILLVLLVLLLALWLILLVLTLLLVVLLVLTLVLVIRHFKYRPFKSLLFVLLPSICNGCRFPCKLPPYTLIAWRNGMHTMLEDNGRT